LAEKLVQVDKTLEDCVRTQMLQLTRLAEGFIEDYTRRCRKVYAPNIAKNRNPYAHLPVGVQKFLGKSFGLLAENQEIPFLKGHFNVAGSSFLACEDKSAFRKA